MKKSNGNDEHKPGYKHTALGWIPEEWEVVRIQELLDKKILLDHIDGNHGELYPKAEEFVEEGVPYVSANNFADGFVNFEECKKLPIERARQFKKGIAKKGDVLFAHNATVGPVAILETELDFVILSTTATYFRCKLDALNNLYLKEFFTSSFFINQYVKVMGQSTRNQVPITTQRKFLTIFPPISEQTKIAAILSTWDAAITKTTQLIQLRQQRKKALMQQLLTGKKRLPGFDGAWKKAKLKDVFERVTRRNDEGNSNIVTISAQKGFVRQNDFFNKIVASEILDNYFLVHRGEFCYNKSYSNGYPWGATKRLKSFEKAVVTTLYICFGIKDEQQHSGDFFEQFFEAGLLDRGLMKVAHEGGRAHGLLNVTPSDFFNLEIMVPDYEEQNAIASVLQTADNEIGLLRKKLDALKEQKKGLMQQLLTGKKRVKI